MRILEIRYPTKFSNASMHKKTGVKHVSNTIREARWKLFGRSHPQKAMYNTSIYSYGRRITSLPLTLERDLHILYAAASSLRDFLYYRGWSLIMKKSWSFKKPHQRQSEMERTCRKNCGGWRFDALFWGRRKTPINQVTVIKLLIFSNKVLNKISGLVIHSLYVKTKTFLI